MCGVVEVGDGSGDVADACYGLADAAASVGTFVVFLMLVVGLQDLVELGGVGLLWLLLLRCVGGGVCGLGRLFLRHGDCRRL